MQLQFSDWKAQRGLFLWLIPLHLYLLDFPLRVFSFICIARMRRYQNGCPNAVSGVQKKIKQKQDFYIRNNMN